MVKIILRIVLSKFGIKIFADPPKPATTESAKGKSSTPKSSKKKAKVAPMPASAVAALEGATFREDRLEPIAKRTITVVTNNCIFKEEDIIKTFNDKDAPVPKIIPESLPSLLKLAQTANLHLVTQFPHSMHSDLTAYMESRVVPSKRAVHGEWAMDRPEKLILKALDEAGVFAAGMHNKRKCVFCETTEGRGYIARTISENTDTGALALHVDDSTESVNWLQNVCTNTTVVGIKTEINKGQFSKPKKGAPAIVVGGLADYFEKKD